MDYEATDDVVVPVTFVWHYGGRSVYLCGSFTDPAGHPMTPVEGRPNEFQAVFGLPPGYYQYKYIVDGEWRHDEHQPFESGEYGTVNTVFVNRETANVLQMHSGSSMDVDNEVFQRVVRIADGPLHESMPRVPEVDLELSRHRIAQFLSTHVAYELIPESGKVITLDVDLPVKQAFHILYEQTVHTSLASLYPQKSFCLISTCETGYFRGIPMAPLWDSFTGQFVGVLSALDFILIIRELSSHGSNLTEEELETHTISAWREVKLFLKRGTDGNERAFSRQLVHAGPDDNLKDVALKIIQNNVATVPIIYSPMGCASCPQLLHLASLSEILKCICRYFKHTSASLPILQLPVGAFSLGTWVPRVGESNQRALSMLRTNSSIGTAFNLLLQAQVSSLPVVDENDSLVDVYSRSDITALAKDRVYTHMNLEEMTISQALLLGQDPYSPEYSSQRCNMCLRSDPLYKVMEKLSKPGVRRLIVVEAGSKRVQGIITLTDMFKLLIG